MRKPYYTFKIYKGYADSETFAFHNLNELLAELAMRGVKPDEDELFSIWGNCLMLSNLKNNSHHAIGEFYPKEECPIMKRFMKCRAIIKRNTLKYNVRKPTESEIRKALKSEYRGRYAGMEYLRSASAICITRLLECKYGMTRSGHVIDVVEGEFPWCRDIRMLAFEVPYDNAGRYRILHIAYDSRSGELLNYGIGKRIYDGDSIIPGSEAIADSELSKAKERILRNLRKDKGYDAKEPKLGA